MKTQLLKITFFLSLFCLVGFTARKAPVLAKTKTTFVWICLTKNAYAYHLDYNCRGMKQCKGEKKKVSLNDAIKKYERKLCGWED